MFKKISPKNSLQILILEDDIDQMSILIDFTLDEIKKIARDVNTNDSQRKILKNLQIIKISNIDSLKKAVSKHKDIFFTVLDCNTPDTKGGVAKDQLITTNHIVTGQHKAVDLVTKYLPNAQITMISSLDRFQRIINSYYERTHDLNIRFVRKGDPLKIQKNIARHLKEHLKSVA